MILESLHRCLITTQEKFLLAGNSLRPPLSWALGRGDRHRRAAVDLKWEKT